MQILQYQNKGNHLNTIERFYIYTEFTKNNHLNDKYNISPNKIFDALLNPNKTKQWTQIPQSLSNLQTIATWSHTRDHSPRWLP
jgi:hypothetical protein